MAYLPKIVIVGGGAGGLELATHLGRSLGKRKQAEITLIDPNRIHLWKPLLHEVASGALDTGHEALSYRAHSAENHYYFRLGAMQGLDKSNQTLTLAPLLDHHNKEILKERQVDYDYLVIAVGAKCNDFGTSGVKEFCYSLDNANQADDFHLTLLNRFLQFSEQPEALQEHPQVHIAIVGAGATGVELSAELYNAVDRLEQFGVKHIHHNSLKVTLIEAADRVLPVLPEDIASKAHQTLTELGVEIKTQTRVSAVKAYQLTLIEPAKTHHLEADLMVWAAGVQAPEFLSQLGLPTNRIHQIEVKATLQVKGETNIFAIGDCASYQKPGAQHPVPATAQAAHQMAVFCAQNIEAIIHSHNMSNFEYHDYGTLVSLSHFQTVGNLLDQLFHKKWTIEGRSAQFAYASLYRQHQYTLHGAWKTFWLLLSHLIEKRIKPKLKLY